VYRSGADSTLHSIYLHAYPNAFRDDRTIYAREGERWGEDYAIRLSVPEERGWMTIDSVTAGGAPAAVTLEDTVARIDLPRPLGPRDSVTLRLRFEVQVPKPFNRLGHVGDNYSMGQWYPKMVVYDDLGWHPDPYHYFSEFYGDYGTFDVAITLPDRFWVGATGVFQRATGGDNEIPLADSETAPDSVSIRVRTVPADSLRSRWPGDRLSLEGDLAGPGAKKSGTIEVKREQGAVLRAPRGAPVHYSYLWVESERESRREADAAGRAEPLRLVRASRDTTVVDTIRALAAKTAPEDSATPSLKTLRFHADRVHDFAWVASPDYVRADTVWNKIAIRALAYRDDQDRWSDQRAFTVSAIRFMSQEVGPYVWPSFTSAESYMGGGAMEYPMLIMNEPDLVSDWFEFLDVVIGHEVGHNWFYGMLGSDERAHPWLDEGFTQYMENRYSDWKYPHGIFKRRKLLPWTSPARDFFDDENRYLSRVYARDEQSISTPAEGYNGYPAYGVAAYSKPAMMLRSLRAYLGEPTFHAFLREYYRANLLRHPRPADVVAAAEKASGLTLGDWFRPWLEGTGIASYSSGEMHHDIIEDDRVAWVRIRREGDRLEPLTVRATYKDGHREERIIPAQAGPTKIIFGPDERIARVEVDPDHDLVERTRLDNRTGMRPLRLKPLFDFRSSEAMTFLYGPMLWHGRAEGARIGLWTVGRYLPLRDFPQGILAAGGSAVVGTRRGDFSYNLWASRRAGGLGARGRIALESARDAGLFRAGVLAGNLVTQPGQRHPFREWRLSLDYRDRYDLEPVDPRYWSPGKGLHAKALLVLDTKGPRRAEHVQLDLRAGSSVLRKSGDPDPEFHYERATLEARQKLDLMARGNAHLAWRLFAGSTFDRPPRELLLDVAEGGRVDSLGRFYLNDRGPLFASGRYWMPGGAGLRGYRGRAALGERAWGLSVDLDLPMLPVSVFGDVGGLETTRVLADAGLGYSFGPLRFVAPFWVGTPEPGRSPWRFRWLVTLEALPISF
jgi:hypothetical protein